MEKPQPLSELDSKLNELAFRLGMSRQHKKLIKELLVELTKGCYHDGYHEGYDDALADDRNARFADMKENAE